MTKENHGVYLGVKILSTNQESPGKCAPQFSRLMLL